ncbi:D-alanyl-D-alanine carboxypeptidase family protein [Clostridium vincentii]|uniref:D-alanyl-D-alanine carboxypeptidase DacF n=1 Tax=Clostridium vincentii TaxID=52704 RepID=A0A2T0BBK3_9CLOT|nr:serine hydrolase [Clostridium vincentii]PRR81279.1 D-alanyl-D-alanine carboxypeptidase DacF precursor [Clostridium vincentii]
MTKKRIIKTLALALSISLLAPFASKVIAKENAVEPTIVSQAAIVMDYDTGEIIYEKNANDKMFLASTTKLMTSLLFAEKFNKTDSITYTETAKAQPPYSLDSNYMKTNNKEMTVGDTLSADVVMKTLLLYSANDAAYMVSDAVGGDTANFSNLMNAKAEEFGLTGTHYENPNGLPGSDGSDVNYSTAYELAVITKKAYENDWIRETLMIKEGDKEATVTLPQDTIINLIVRNEELGKNGNIGGKTGFTNEAGNCFAGVYERNDKKYIGIVFKSGSNQLDKTRFPELNSMMDYSTSVDKVTYKKAGEEVGTTDLEYKLFRFFGPTKTITAPIILNEDVNLYDNKINNSEAEIILNSSETNAWKVASQDETPLEVKVKGFTLEVNGNVEISGLDLIKANAIIYIAALAVIIIIVVLILFIIKMMNNRGNKRSRYKRRRY